MSDPYQPPSERRQITLQEMLLASLLLASGFGLGRVFFSGDTDVDADVAAITEAVRASSCAAGSYLTAAGVAILFGRLLFRRRVKITKLVVIGGGVGIAIVPLVLLSIGPAIALAQHGFFPIDCVFAMDWWIGDLALRIGAYHSYVDYVEWWRDVGSNYFLTVLP